MERPCGCVVHNSIRYIVEMCYNCRLRTFRSKCIDPKCEDEGHPNLCKYHINAMMPNIYRFISYKKDINLFMPIDDAIKKEENRERLFSHGEAPNPPISFAAPMSAISAIVGFEVTEEDYFNFRKLYKKYRWDAEMRETFSIVIDIIICKRFQPIARMYREFIARSFNTVMVESRELGKEKISLLMRCKTGSFLDRVGSSKLTTSNLNEKGEYIFRFKDGFTQDMLKLYSAFSIEMGNAARYQLVTI